MGNLKKEDVEALMAQQRENLSDPSTMASVHNLLRINKLDEQHKEILAKLDIDAMLNGEIEESLKVLTDKVDRLLPEDHDKHHDRIAARIAEEETSEVQWRTIRTNAIAGMAILFAAFVGKGLWEFASAFFE